MARLWGEAPGPSTTVAHALATKVAVGVAVVATGTGAAVAAAVPGAGDIGAALFTPRCYVTDGCDPPGDADELLAIQRWIQTYEDDPSITLEHCGDAISDEERWCARIYTDSTATADLVGTGSGHAATLHGPFAEYVDALDKDGTAANPPCRIVQISEDGSGGHHVESPSWCPWDW
jgi:hypothetical protein